MASFRTSCACLLLCASCAIAGRAYSNTLTVTNLNDSGPGSLRDTIAIANGGDTINFAVTGTITLTSTHIVVDKSLTITGPSVGIVVRQQAFNQRIFFIGNGSANGPTVVMSNLTIKDGSNPKPIPIYEDGAGIYNDRSKLMLQNCVVQSCTAMNGGGQFSRPSGGGVASVGSTAELTLLNCYFVDNFATLGGGGASNNGGKLTVSGSFFEDNRSNGNGGHLRHEGSQPALVAESTLLDSDGAAISNSGPLEVRNCTFVGNAPFGVDAGSIVNNGSLLVQHCTFYNNLGGNNGTIRNYGAGQLTVRNNIFQNPGTSCLRNDAPGTTTSAGYNLANSDPAGLLTGPGDQINPDAKLDPAGLQNNGGATPTIALLSTSPALDRGNSFGLTSDQRGMPRPVDIPGFPNLADGSDIGAYESPADPLQDGSAGFFVNTTADHDDGICGRSDCTLREAINRSNQLSSADTILISFGGTITLLPSAGGQINITDGVTIVGPGARSLKISAGTQTRVFFVSGAGTTTLSGLTIADGWMANSNAGDAEGAGIYNQGTLSLVDCTLDFNRTTGGSGFSPGQSGGHGRGGAIFNAGALTLYGCTFKNNRVFGGSGAGNSGAHTTGGGGGSGSGACVYNAAGASLAIANSTFAGNGAGGGNGGNGGMGGNGGDGLGGAIYNLGTLDVSAATASANYGDGGAGGLGVRTIDNGAHGLGAGGFAHGGGTSTLRNSIIAGNDSLNARDVSGAFNSGGFNLIGRIDGGTGFNAIGDQTGTNATPLDAQLGTLANNGGATDTMALQPASPAVDQGQSFGLTSDQRGSPRPTDLPGTPNANGGDGSDIGAFEFAPLSLSTVVSRKLHGGGGEFDIAFPGVESRGGGGMHTIIFTFSNPLASVGGVSITGSTAVTSSSGIGNDPHQYVVSLGGVPDAQQLTITLSNVADQSGGSISSVPATVAFLLGDANGDRFVNSADAIVTRNRSGQTTDGNNFRSDHNIDGFINSGDGNIVRTRSGSFIP